MNSVETPLFARVQQTGNGSAHVLKSYSAGRPPSAFPQDRLRLDFRDSIQVCAAFCFTQSCLGCRLSLRHLAGLGKTHRQSGLVQQKIISAATCVNTSQGG